MRTGRAARRHVWIVLAPALGVLLAGLAPSARASGGCVLDEAFDRWHPLTSVPPGSGEVQQLDDDPCTLFTVTAGGALWRSLDAGRSWKIVHRAAAPIARLLVSGLGPGKVVLALDGPAGGAEISTTGGDRFHRATGLDDFSVLAGWTTAAVASRPAITFLVGRPLPAGQPAGLPGVGPTVRFSAATEWAFESATATAHLRPGHVIADPGDPSTIWVTTALGVADGLLRSDDGASSVAVFAPQQSPAITASIRSLDVRVAPSGETVLLAGTGDGLYTSSPGVSAWTRRRPDSVVAARFDATTWGLMVVASDGDGATTRVLRSVDGGETFRPADRGLSGDCRASSLSRDEGAVTTFLLRCAARTYRYRSSGRDLARPPATPPAPPGLASPPPLPTPEQMRPLLTHSLRSAGTSNSTATVAFDGAILYYSSPNVLVVHRTWARNGTHLPDIDLTTGRIGADSARYRARGGSFYNHVDQVDYDSRRDLLYVTTVLGLYSYDLTTHEQRKLFAWSCVQTPCRYVRVSFDATTDTFKRSYESRGVIEEYDRTGRLVGSCSVTDTVGVEDEESTKGASAIAATGHGEFYIQLEDDATVLRFNRRCDVEGTWVHRVYSESGMESDQMACDTVTFPVAALWIRDAAPNTITAYEVPDGYCPAGTRLALPPRIVLRPGQTRPVCATLTLGGRIPVPDQLVTIEVGNQVAGTGTTDVRGRACAPFTASRARASRSGSGPGPHVVASLPTHAVFLGSRRYQASAAAGRLDVVDELPATAPERQLPGLVLTGPHPAPRIPEPVAQPQPQPQPQVQAQPNPNPQSQPQAQGQGQAQAAAVPQEQAQRQVATVQVPGANSQTEPAMVRLRRRLRPNPVGVFGLAVVMTLAYGAFTRELVFARQRSGPRYAGQDDRH